MQLWFKQERNIRLSIDDIITFGFSENMLFFGRSYFAFRNNLPLWFKCWSEKVLIECGVDCGISSFTSGAKTVKKPKSTRRERWNKYERWVNLASSQKSSWSNLRFQPILLQHCQCKNFETKFTRRYHDTSEWTEINKIFLLRNRLYPMLNIHLPFSEFRMQCDMNGAQWAIRLPIAIR